MCSSWVAPMAGRSLKGSEIDKEYSPKSDIDTLIVSEHLFTSYVMKSLEWVKDITKPAYAPGKHPQSPQLKPEQVKHIGWLSESRIQGNFGTR